MSVRGLYWIFVSPGCVITERLDDREARGPLCGSVRDRTHQSDGEDGDRDDGVRGEVERIIWRRRRGWSDDIGEEATQPNPQRQADRRREDTSNEHLQD